MSRYHEIDRLREEDFTVEEKSPWHFHVMGNSTYVNVWPTKRKWMVAFGSGASYYKDADDLLAIVKRIIKRDDPRWLVNKINAEYEASITPEMQEAEVEWREGLAKIYAIIKV